MNGKQNIESFYVFNTGCIRRAIDMLYLQRYFQKNGLKYVENIKKADLIIIATCGVVKKNEENSLKAIEIAVRKKRKDATIVVSGCLPVINPEPIRKIGDFYFITSGKLDEFDNFINAKIKFNDVEQPDSIRDNKILINYLIARSFCRKSKIYRFLFYRYFFNKYFLSLSVVGNNILNRLKNLIFLKETKKIIPYYSIKIADGCNSECSFCATKYAIGKIKSVPIEKIIKQFKEGLNKGYRIFQLIAEDTGCYGIDIGKDLAELLEKIFEIKGNYKLVIIDCSPRWIIEKKERILPVLVKNQDKIKEIFLPIQSGSNKILKDMNRKYKIEDVKEVVSEIRQKAPKINIRTTFIVGFPGETEDDFNQTVEIIKSFDFDEVTINRYEDRPKTLSSRFVNKIPPDIIEERVKYLEKNLGCKILS